MNREKIKEPKQPFRTTPDHEHIYKKIAEFRKYDIKKCISVLETSNPKKAALHRADKKWKGALTCGKQIFVLRRRVRGKKALVGIIQADIIVPVHLTNGFRSMEIVPTR